MIITKSWLNEWIDVKDKNVQELCLTLNQIGLEVDGSKSFRVPENVIVGFVLECEKHPEADKLNVCKVDVGTGVRQIVCGASNVREGIYVAVAMIGAVMPSGMEIKPVKLRGVESDGMICSATELTLPAVNEGILILDDTLGELKAGRSLLEYDILNDDVIEIELTANRGDCLSHQGVARDLAAAFDRALKKQEVIDSDYRKQGTGKVMHLTQQNDIQADVIYKSFEYTDFELPLKIRYRLALIEEPYKTNLEAVLAYTTLSTGVALRTYRHDFFVQENSIAQIQLKEDENKITYIEGKSRASYIGIEQNKESMVSQSGQKVILEASYIDPTRISKQVFDYKLATDALYYRTSRGSDFDINLGISTCADILINLCSITMIPGTFEYFSPFQPLTLNLDICSINDQIGDKVSKAKIVKILTALEFTIIKSQEDNIVVHPPRYRHDIMSEQDVVEEIVRMVGIDNIRSNPLTFIETNTANAAYKQHIQKKALRLKSAQEGFFETQSYLFVDRKKMNALGFETMHESIELTNPIIETMDTMRSSILPALIEAASNNKRLGQKRIAFFEYGTVFTSNRTELVHLCFLQSGENEAERVSNAGQAKAINFEMFVQKIANVVGAFELEPMHETTNALQHPYQSAYILINGTRSGEVFKLHPQVAVEYDLNDTFLAQISVAQLTKSRISVEAYSKYQAVHRDLSIVVPKTYVYSTIKDIVNAQNIDVLTSFNLVDSYSDEKLAENESITLRFTLQSLEKTLNDQEITQVMQTLLDAFQKAGYSLR